MNTDMALHSSSPTVYFFHQLKRILRPTRTERGCQNVVSDYHFFLRVNLNALYKGEHELLSSVLGRNV